MSKNLSWSAGFFDGEGCISVHRGLQKSGSFSHYLNLDIGNTNTDALNRFQNTFDFGARHRTRDGVNKPMYHLVYSSNEAVKVLQNLLPELTVKKKEAELALDFASLLEKTKFAGWKGKRLPIETQAMRDAYYWALREAKK